MPLRVLWGCSGCIVGAASARAPHSRAAAVSAASTALRQRMHVQQQHYHTRKEQGGGPALKYIHSTEVNMACTASLRNGFTRGTGAVTTHSGHYCQAPQTRQQQQQQRHRHLSTTASRLKINPAWTKRQKATTPPPAPTPAEVLQTLPPFTLSAEKQIRPEAQAVMAALDSKVVGHQEIKDALLIALVSREHVYIEGVPGAAKTMLAEVLGDAAGLDTHFCQLHRDTRVQELIGDAIVVKEAEPDGSEVIRQGVEPGGITTAELCILDDISRAPGEALNILLRLLNERKFHSTPIPLLCAVATGNPVVDGSYVEPLDPATVDRFTIQVQSTGLIQGSQWGDASEVLAAASAILHQQEETRRAHHQPQSPQQQEQEQQQQQPRHVDRVQPVGRKVLDAAYSKLVAVKCTPEVQTLLVKLLAVLRAQCTAPLPSATSSRKAPSSPTHSHSSTSSTASAASSSDDAQISMLTDRTFLVKAVKLLKAEAYLRGRTETIPADLHVLRFLTTFRLPAHVHEEIAPIIQAVIDGFIDVPMEGSHESGNSEDGEADKENADGDDGTGVPEQNDPAQNDPTEEGGSSGDGEHDEAEVDVNDQDVPQDGSKADDTAGTGGDSNQAQQATDNLDPNDSNADDSNRPEYQHTADDIDEDEEFFEMQQPEANPDGGKKDGGEDGDDAPAELAYAEVGDVNPLLRVLRGRIDRGNAEFVPHRGGHPRSFERLRNFDDFGDTDPVEGLLWNDNPTPELPRIYKRSKIDGGGAVAVLRDTSMSMNGLWTHWAASLVQKIVDLSSSKRMRVGYIEFNHRLKQYTSNGQFFTRDYDALAAAVASAKCEGVTDYQLPISTALAEFRGQRIHQKHNQHILFLTDGLPTAGDRHLKRELALAKSLGVCIHTVFIGYQRFPAVLTRLSDTSGGSKFSAFVDPKTGMITIVELGKGGAAGKTAQNTRTTFT